MTLSECFFATGTVEVIHKDLSCHKKAQTNVTMEEALGFDSGCSPYCFYNYAYIKFRSNEF